MDVRRVSVVNSRLIRHLNTPSEYDTAVRSNAVSIGRKVFLHRDHHYALVSWVRAGELGLLKPPSVLFHFDEHYDLGSFPITVKPDELRGRPLSTVVEEQVCQLDHQPDLIPEENLITPALALGVVDEVYHILPTGPKGPKLNEYTVHALGLSSPLRSDGEKVLDLEHRHFPQGISYFPWHERTLETVYQGLLRPADRTVILDLDIDFFCAKETKGLAELPDFIRFARFLRPDVVTVAFSPMASNWREAYSNLNDQTCSDIIDQLTEALGLEEIEVAETPEKRRTCRWSSK